MSSSNKLFVLTSTEFLPNVEPTRRGSIHGNNLSNFLHVFFNFAYFLLLSPFRFKEVSVGQYEFHRWPPQRILCGLASIMTVAKLATALRSTFEQVKSSNPASFFFLFIAIFSLISKVTSLRSFWLKPEAYLKLVNFLQSDLLLPLDLHGLDSIPAISLLGFSYVGVCFLRLLFESELPLSDWSPEMRYRWLVVEARYTFFLANGTDLRRAPDLSEISLLDSLLAIMHAAFLLFRYFVGHFIDLQLLSHIWTLWSPTCAFVESLERNQTEFGRKVGVQLALKRYDALKHLSRLVNEAIGDSILFCMPSFSFYLAMSFEDLVLLEDEIRRGILIHSYVAYFSMLLFSAEITRKMRLFKTWLFESGKWRHIDPNKFPVIMDDLKSKVPSVAISACGVFAFTHRIVGTLLSVLITYFVIRLQSEAVRTSQL